MKFEIDLGRGEVAERPSDYECSCKDRNPDDHVLTITEGRPAVTHVVCGKQIDDQGYIEDWNTSEPIPVRVEFVDQGMSAATPDGPAEHNGFWWEISPRPPEVR